MISTCPKCNYNRQPSDTTPDYECPKCHIIYEKYIAYQQRLAEQVSEQVKKQAKKGLWSLLDKVLVVISFAIIINVFFTLPLSFLVNKILDNSYSLLSWKLSYYLESGKSFISIVLAVIPAIFLIYYSDLWSRILPPSKFLFSVLVASNLLYLIAISNWLIWLFGLFEYYIYGGFLSFHVFSNILIIYSAIEVLSLVVTLLLNVNTPIEE